MTTRLNNRTFAVKNMNVLKNNISFNNDVSVLIPKFFGMSRSTIFKSGFIKFNQFFADCLFVSKKFDDIKEDTRKLFTRETPRDLISLIRIFFVSIKKSVVTSKTFYKPFKDWKFCVVAMKISLIYKVRAIFIRISLQAKGTFSINKSCEIAKFQFRSLFREFNIVENFTRVTGNKIFRMLKHSNFLKAGFPFFLTDRSNRLQKDLGFFSFFNKKRNDILDKIKGFCSRNRELILGFMCRNSIARNPYDASIMLGEKHKNFLIGRRNNERMNVFNILSSFSDMFADKKTAIAVYISCTIGSYLLFVHTYKYDTYRYLSHESNRVDLPTEMAVSDLDDIVSVLQTNDGEYITNMINASDKIGTSPIGDAYAMLCSSRMIPVLNNITGFRRKFEYGTGSINTLSSEWGGVNNIRAFISSQGSVSADASLLGADIANCFVTAYEGYKVVFQAGGRAKYIYTPPGYMNDPAHLRHTAACQFYQGQCINNDLWVQNLRSTGI